MNAEALEIKSFQLDLAENFSNSFQATTFASIRSVFFDKV
jgi:hypothetical protein